MDALTRREKDFADILAGKKPEPRWVPACGGTEKPFTSRSGVRMLYCWDSRGNHGHAYLNLDTDRIMSNEEAASALAL